MTLIYMFAVLALVVVGYLVRDFYNEQLRERMAPLRAELRQLTRRIPRH